MLHVDCDHRNHAALWCRPFHVGFGALPQFIFLWQLAAIFPWQAQRGIPEGDHFAVVALILLVSSFKKLTRQNRYARTAKGGHEFIEQKADGTG